MDCPGVRNACNVLRCRWVSEANCPFTGGGIQLADGIFRFDGKVPLIWIDETHLPVHLGSQHSIARMVVPVKQVQNQICPPLPMAHQTGQVCILYDLILLQPGADPVSRHLEIGRVLRRLAAHLIQCCLYIFADTQNRQPILGPGQSHI